MNDFNLAQAIHTIAMVIWIGGLAFVATVPMPLIRRTAALEEF